VAIPLSKNSARKSSCEDTNYTRLDSVPARQANRHKLQEAPTNWCTFVKSVPRACPAGVAFAASIGVKLLAVSIVSGQNFSPIPESSTAEVERVIVTGSNIPTAEETGPNPVDTYRPADMEKLGIRTATDLLTNLPQEIGTTSSQTNLGFGDGAVQPSLRGLLPRETLVLIDGKRVSIIGSGGNTSFVSSSGSISPSVDINLIPFPMIDHIDILKDGRLGSLWQRRGGWGDQHLFVTQVPWS
jgi:hypothetical protein